jgi:NAD(P)-dependent dehydrogenase (short-subunit alcohol dehydrogenase family)
MLIAQSAAELGELGIRVNAVAPGAIDVTGDERLRQPQRDVRYTDITAQASGAPGGGRGGWWASLPGGL